MAITLVRHALGDARLQSCASRLRTDHEHEHALAALQANAQQHMPTTRDHALARAMAWMDSRLDAPHSPYRLTDAAAVRLRTLLQHHFQLELSQPPLDHLHRMRCTWPR